jgi:hypothetical protein
MNKKKCQTIFWKNHLITGILFPILNKKENRGAFTIWEKQRVKKLVEVDWKSIPNCSQIAFFKNLLFQDLAFFKNMFFRNIFFKSIMFLKTMFFKIMFLKTMFFKKMFIFKNMFLWTCFFQYGFPKIWSTLI